MARPLLVVTIFIYVATIFLMIAAGPMKRFSCVRCSHVCLVNRMNTEPATLLYCSRCNLLCSKNLVDPWMTLSANKKRKFNTTEVDPDFEVDPATGATGSGSAVAMKGRTLGGDDAPSPFGGNAMTWWGRRR